MRVSAVASLSWLLALGCGGRGPEKPEAPAPKVVVPAAAKGDVLARALASADPVERMAAAKRAGATAAAAVLPQLEEMARADADPDVRQVAGRAVRELKAAPHAEVGKADVDALLAQLKSQDPFARLQAAKKLGLVTRPPQRVLQALVAVATEDGDEDVRAVAKRSWNQQNGTRAEGPAAGVDRPATLSLLRDLDSPKANARRDALEVLQQQNPDDPDHARGRNLFGDLLRESLTSQDPQFQAAVRRAAVRITAMAEDDPDHDTRLTARQLAAAIRDYEALGKGEAKGDQPAAPAVETKPAPSLVGAWNGSATAQGMTMVLVLHFRADGTFLLESTAPSGMQQAQNGTYTYQDGAVTTTPAGGGQLERASLDWIDADSFTYFGGGFKVKFTRRR